MGEEKPWLAGYAWPVHRAHAEYVASNCFDAGSVFHSAMHMYLGWEDLQCSVQVLENAGTPGRGARDANAVLPIAVRLHEWAAGREQVRLRVTNGALIALLETGDVAAFKARAEVF